MCKTRNDMKRTLHQEVRVVYRALRRIYGTEKTQDEALRIFKAVYPEQILLTDSEEPTATIPNEVRDQLYQITRSWHPKGKLKEVIAMAELYFGMPTEMFKEEVLVFYKDITPVAMRIRKLTPRECFRLMGVSEEDIDTIQSAGISKSSQYKLAGNSIVAGGTRQDSHGHWDGVLFHLFRKMFIETGPDITDKPIQLTLF